MVSKESKIPLVVAGLLLGILMGAMDNTIVAAAMPTIVSELGGIEQYAWVTAAYMVTTMAGMPIFGKLSDMYGRKKFYVFGLLIFLLGSMLCGLADSIVSLSIYRAIQGIGGGALMPIAFTIIFDLFPPEKRGKMTGLFGAVFGISSVSGPLLGAYITEYISWQWIFYINIPLGILSLFFVTRFYKESLTFKKQKIDWYGASTLVIAVVSLMFALELGGKEYAWDSWQLISLFVIFGVFFLLFLYVETKATDPIISFSLFKRPIFAASQAIAFFYGAAFIIPAVYIPMYMQGVHGGAATSAGLVLMPMMLGSVVGSSAGGILASKVSFRSLMTVSVMFFAIGIYFLSTLTPTTPQHLLTIYMILTGVGVGFSFSLLSMASVHELPASQRGTATSTNSFFRSLGMTLGITIFGTLQTNLLTSGLSSLSSGGAPMGMDGGSRELLSSEAREAIPAPILEQITNVLSSSIADTFLWSLVLVICAAIAVSFMGTARASTGKQPQEQTVQKTVTEN
ncbi:MDR family MFS transporter [Priestia taiwanensis]|uniref:MFS transporter n=1 Tax=Priestia taiwanensis TaxID=1347902 RepID=A0A917ARQ2_9BACI|nr:MDR family MFS transporter [Priestia taiwanensis]MBM7363124.1 EmrB/QacA subfamily drug resistance transporter [Priestia taiwanensis]GGE67872.1 MFS transporter [Priestia taiwanensis]